MKQTVTSLYYSVPALSSGATINDDRLSNLHDRYRIEIERPYLTQNESLINDALSRGAGGLVIEMSYGWATRRHLKLAKNALDNEMSVWFYWPVEKAVEFIDDERWFSHRRLWVFVKAIEKAYAARVKFIQIVSNNAPQKIKPALKFLKNRLSLFKNRLLRSSESRENSTQALDSDKFLVSEYEQMLNRIIECAKPVALRIGSTQTRPKTISGVGVYLRTDYWAPISTGGSYGHSSYVAKELAETTESLLCLMANRFSLMDELNLHQIVMEKPSATSDELSIIKANEPYYKFLSEKFTQVKPAYIYERLCLGNFVGARLSQEFGIPYIVEYNGSEISMRRSFDNSGEFEYQNFFLKAEEAAFKQAALISVISDPVRDDLLGRGIPSSRILVNPNGVDAEAYKPMNNNERQLLRHELGFSPSDRVVGFIGTFGGWHGIDVLAEAIPLICKKDENIQFLLIGDGNFKHLIDEAIRRHNLQSRVICTGRVPHQRGANLLGACDMFASPHSSHMVDSRFFGSPTKLFEYMSMGGGIIASDLEQIGEVLSPALRAANLSQADQVNKERSILCAPGSVEEFVKATIFLARNPQVCEAIGSNARQAAVEEYSWRSHVERLWAFATKN